MGSFLTIRNLSLSTLHLKHVEEIVSREKSALTSIQHNVTSLVRKSTSTATVKLDNAGSQREIALSIQPYARVTTDIAVNSSPSQTVFRLTFENDDKHVYQLDIPSKSSSATENGSSKTVLPQTGAESVKYSWLYVTSTSLLTIYACPDLSTWMKHIDDSVSLTSLSIPGTHNSVAHHRTLPSVRCQAVSPATQLLNGIRFFDIRVQPNSDTSNTDLVLVHGEFPVSLTGPKHFQALLGEVQSFLSTHPSETVILSIKREGKGNATDEHLSRILHDHYISASRPNNDASPQWCTTPHIPTLAEARGKIVLFRRFVLDQTLKDTYRSAGGWGLNAHSWKYNTDFDSCDIVCVQDVCETPSADVIHEKIECCQRHFRRAAGADPHSGRADDHGKREEKLYINFLSASNFWKVGCWPEKIAARMNPAMVQFLCETDLAPEKTDDKVDQQKNFAGRAPAGLGIAVCDWVGKDDDWDLVKCILGYNAPLYTK